MFKLRNPNYAKYKFLKGEVITLEGIIGAGKSTLGMSLEKYLTEIGLPTKFYPEYVNIKLLSQYINNMNKYAYSFQLFMLAKRIEIYREAEMFAKTGGIAIIDRSIIGDMTFCRMQKNNGVFSDDEFSTYISIIKQEIQLTPTTSLYLHCTPETSLERVKNRGIHSEVTGYTLEYMKQLKEAYEISLKECDNVKHILINWEDPQVLENKFLSEAKIIEILDLLKN